MPRDTTTAWLVMGIGCIECCESSRPMGIHLSESEAQSQANRQAGDFQEVNVYPIEVPHKVIAGLVVKAARAEGALSKHK